MSKQTYKVVPDFATWGFTQEGGIYQTLINQTGDLSVKGTIVIQSADIDNAVDIATAGSPLAIGVIYENDIADGSPVKVVVYGKAQVLLRDGQGVARGSWCVLSSVASGRMEQSTISLTTTVAAYAEGIGVSLESQSSGTDVLAFVQLQFN